MSITRRKMIKSVIAGSTIGVSLSSGLLTPQQLLAAWPETLFNKSNLNDVMNSLGIRDLSMTTDITITAPELAEDGAVVPVSISTTIPGVEKISLLVDKNPYPLVATFKLSQKCRGYVSTRIKMKEPSNIIVIVEANGSFYSNRKLVNVAIGGCDE